jgi:serine/threonine-protein kinase
VPEEPEELRVPEIEDLSRAEAVRVLEREGFTVGRIETKESSEPAGTVLDQKPSARARARRGSPVDLVVAVPRPVKVPDVVGDSREEAVRELTRRGLTVGAISDQPSCDQPGEVVAQQPAEDVEVTPGTAVSLVVRGTGPKPAVVPRVIGLGRVEAERAIRAEGLEVRRVERRESDREPPETVVDQRPAAFARLAPGCPVDLVVVTSVGCPASSARAKPPRGACCRARCPAPPASCWDPSNTSSVAERRGSSSRRIRRLAAV